MSTLNIYSILDVQINEFSTPFFAPNNIIASRMFEQSVLKKSSDHNLYPQHFALVHLGTFQSTINDVPSIYDTDDKNIFTIKKSPEIVCRATDFITEQLTVQLDNKSKT
jgi:hypothetical protein